MKFIVFPEPYCAYHKLQRPFKAEPKVRQDQNRLKLDIFEFLQNVIFFNFSVGEIS